MNKSSALAVLLLLVLCIHSQNKKASVFVGYWSVGATNFEGIDNSDTYDVLCNVCPTLKFNVDGSGYVYNTGQTRSPFAWTFSNDTISIVPSVRFLDERNVSFYKVFSNVRNHIIEMRFQLIERNARYTKSYILRRNHLIYKYSEDSTIVPKMNAFIQKALSDNCLLFEPYYYVLTKLKEKDSHNKYNKNSVLYVPNVRLSMNDTLYILQQDVVDTISIAGVKVQTQIPLETYPPSRSFYSISEPFANGDSLSIAVAEYTIGLDAENRTAVSFSARRKYFFIYDKTIMKYKFLCSNRSRQ